MGSTEGVEVLSIFFFLLPLTVKEAAHWKPGDIFTGMDRSGLLGGATCTQHQWSCCSTTQHTSQLGSHSCWSLGFTSMWQAYLRSNKLWRLNPVEGYPNPWKRLCFAFCKSFGVSFLITYSLVHQTLFHEGRVVNNFAKYIFIWVDLLPEEQNHLEAFASLSCTFYSTTHFHIFIVPQSI
jgi:hypothetical protein